MTIIESIKKHAKEHENEYFAASCIAGGAAITLCSAIVGAKYGTSQALEQLKYRPVEVVLPQEIVDHIRNL